MSQNARISLLIVANLLLYFCVGEINTVLARFSLYFHADVLYLVFFGLFLNRLSSAVYVGLLGLLAESVRPVPGGLYLTGYLAMWLAFNWAQPRIRRQSPAHLSWTSAAIQGLWLLFLCLFLGFRQAGSWAYWQRIFTEGAFSLILVALTAPLWCRLQKDLLHSLGWNLDAQVNHK